MLATGANTNKAEISATSAHFLVLLFTIKPPKSNLFSSIFYLPFNSLIKFFIKIEEKRDYCLFFPYTKIMIFSSNFQKGILSHTTIHFILYSPYLQLVNHFWRKNEKYFLFLHKGENCPRTQVFFYRYHFQSTFLIYIIIVRARTYAKKNQKMPIGYSSNGQF